VDSVTNQIKDFTFFIKGKEVGGAVILWTTFSGLFCKLVWHQAHAVSKDHKFEYKSP